MRLAIWLIAYSYFRPTRNATEIMLLILAAIVATIQDLKDLK